MLGSRPKKMMNMYIYDMLRRNTDTEHPMTQREIQKRLESEYDKTCIFSKGDPPFEDRPEKAYCMIYSREQGVGKPYDVYYEGGLCEFYNDGKEDDVT